MAPATSNRWTDHGTRLRSVVPANRHGMKPFWPALRPAIKSLGYSSGLTPSGDRSMKTQVAIIGAGPSGLLLGALLHKDGIDNVILEQRSADYVLGRIRAGVLEQVTVDLLDEAGVGARMHAEGLPHDGFEMLLRRPAPPHRPVRAHRRQARHGLRPDRADARPDGRARSAPACRRCTRRRTSRARLRRQQPRVRYEKDGAAHEIECDFIAGCDGFHGVCRASVPRGAITDLREGLSLRLAGPAVRHAAGVRRADLRHSPARLRAVLACAARRAAATTCRCR